MQVEAPGSALSDAYKARLIGLYNGYYARQIGRLPESSQKIEGLFADAAVMGYALDGSAIATDGAGPTADEPWERVEGDDKAGASWD